MRSSEFIIESVDENQILNIISKKIAIALFQSFKVEMPKMLRKAELVKKISRPDLLTRISYKRSLKKLVPIYTGHTMIDNMIATSKIVVYLYGSFNARGAYGIGDNKIYLSLIHLIETGNMSDSKSAISLVSSIVSHELQHMLDFYKSKGKSFNISKINDQNNTDNLSPDQLEKLYLDYLRANSEINARFQQATSKIFDKIERLKLRTGLNPEYVEYRNETLLQIITDIFKDLELEPKIINNRRQYNRLIRRAYDYFIHELDKPKIEKSLSLIQKAVNTILRKPTRELK